MELAELSTALPISRLVTQTSLCTACYCSGFGYICYTPSVGHVLLRLRAAALASLRRQLLVSAEAWWS